MTNSNITLVFISLIFIFFTLPVAESFQYTVGDDKGWSIPSGSDNGFYNKWASNHRFRVEDTLRFEYKDDSVLVVTQEDYDKCLSSQPIYFSNDGNSTVFTLDSPVMFFFISGVSGHCERGEKMIVKVLEEHQTSSSPPPSNETAHSSSSAPSLRLITASGLSIFSLFIMFCGLFN